MRLISVFLFLAACSATAAVQLRSADIKVTGLLPHGPIN